MSRFETVLAGPEPIDSFPRAGEKPNTVSYVVRPFQLEAVAPPKDLSSQVWPARFLNKNSGEPLDLEIGCGVGWHPVRYATENPSRRLIAIEHTREKFEKFHARAVRHPELTNLMPVHADAIRWVSHALQDKQLDRCLLLYPNPEPKAANKRWLRSPFLHVLLAKLKTGGELWLATNERKYFDEALDWAKQSWGLEVLEQRTFSQASAPSGIPRTHFEKKYLLRGETCFDVRWRKP